MDSARALTGKDRRCWRDFQAELRSAKQSPDLRIGISATITAEPLIPYLGSALLAKGIGPSIQVAPYGQVFQTCLGWQDAFGAPSIEDASEPLDAIVLLWRSEDLFGDEFALLASDEPQAVARALAKLDDLAVALRTLTESFAGSVVVGLPPYPQSPPIDVRDLSFGDRVRRLHLAVVLRWEQHCANNPRVVSFDLDQIQRSAGTSHIEDLRKWYLYRQPYTEEFWREIGVQLARTLAAERIAARKCIAVDCDDTLWGGVIGEDGLEGIALGDEFPGSAFRDFQRQLVTLHDRGVLIALVSKNDAAAVWEVFDRHDAMVLRREHIAAARINWNPKSDNLVELSRELNFGLDAFVFVDDNPVEIEEVASRLPMVRCLQVPNEPAHLPDILRGSDLFDSLHVTDEDRQRTSRVRSETERVASRAAMTREEFLASLELRVRVTRPGREQLGRITQLINKTNQFNLSTVRRSQEEVAALMDSDSHRVYSLFVTDRFGDYGLVGVAIVEERDGEWSLDTLLMSCRVLGRGVESAFLAAICKEADAADAERVVGTYVPSLKNDIVLGFLANHGFELQVAGGSEWCATPRDTPGVPPHIAAVTDGRGH